MAASNLNESDPRYYPIVHVRGYAMRPDKREGVRNDGCYGFSATSVEKRPAPAVPGNQLQAVGGSRQVADIFEGQLIRFMKPGNYPPSHLYLIYHLLPLLLCLV